MKASSLLLCSLVLLLFVILLQSSDAVPIGGAGAWGGFEGSLTYTPVTSDSALLVVELTNTSPGDNGGCLTGFALNNPGGKITRVTFSDPYFDLLGPPSFNNGINAMPLRYFDIGAALGESWQGGGDPKPGIAAGATKTFVFGLKGQDLDALNEWSFVSEPSYGGSDFFAARFRGFDNGESDKVPAEETLPVILSSFTAIGHAGYVEISWTSQTEVNASAYHLLRSDEENGEYTLVARLEAHGNSESPRNYRCVDDEVIEGRTYYYKLEEEGLGGNLELHEPVFASAGSSIVPHTYGLMANYPNPFNASTAIGYQIPQAGHVNLTIYDVLGRKVRNLVNSQQKAGSYTVQWDSTDDQGDEVKSGVYFYIFEAGGFSDTRKMVLSR